MNGWMRFLVCLILLSAACVANAESVESEVSGQSNWTFMVYLDGDNDLSDYAIADFNEMEQVGSTDQVSIVVLMDLYGAGNSKIYYVTYDDDPNSINSSVVADLGEVNMGDPQTLINFVNFVVNNYPAEHYALVLWNHGDGWRTASIGADPLKGVCWDAESGWDYLNSSELVYALSEISFVAHIDLIGFDACLMAMVENDYLINLTMPTVRVDSEEVEPASGWDYYSTLTSLTANPSMSAEELAAEIVDNYVEYYTTYYEWVTQSAAYVNNDVYGALNEFVQAVMDANDVNAVSFARSAVESFYIGDYVDLYDLAKLVDSYTSYPEVSSAAQALMAAIDSSIVAERHGDEHPNAHGTSIYFPTTEIDEEYYSIPFADTLWDEFLEWYLNSLSEPEWTEIIEDTAGDSWLDILYVYANLTAESVSVKVEFNQSMVNADEAYAVTWLDTDQDSSTGAYGWWSQFGAQGADYAVVVYYYNYTYYGAKEGTVEEKTEINKCSGLFGRFELEGRQEFGAELWRWNESIGDFEYVKQIPAYINDIYIWYTLLLDTIDDDGNIDVREYVEYYYVDYGYDLAPDEGYGVIGEEHKPDIWVSPNEIAVSLPPDTVYTTTLTVGNDGNNVLRFRASASVDQYQLEEVEYAWIDGVIDGTPLEMLDDDSAAVELPFNFTFYDENFGRIYISSNGHASFVNQYPTDYVEHQIPSTDPYDQELIAVLWDDWNPAASDGDVYVKSFDDEFVVTWYNLLHYPNYGPASTFQLVLYENGSIRFNYQTVGYTDGYTVGINEGDGSHYTKYEGDVESEMSLLFEPPQQPWLQVLPTSEITVDPGDSFDLTIVFNTTGLEEGVYDATIIIYSNDPDEEVEIPVELIVSEVLPECLGDCCYDPECQELIESNVSCYVCVNELDGYWKPYPTEACFNGYEPFDLCLRWCPECCNGIDDDSDGAVDFPSDPECTCGLDPSEEEPAPPIPELLTLALVGVGVAGVLIRKL